MSTWATTATSPNHEGVVGTDEGAIWTFTEECIILVLCPPYWAIYLFILLRRHIFVFFTRIFSFCLSSALYCLLFVISLRISWVYHRLNLAICRSGRARIQPFYAMSKTGEFLSQFVFRANLCARKISIDSSVQAQGLANLCAGSGE